MDTKNFINSFIAFEEQADRVKWFKNQVNLPDDPVERNNALNEIYKELTDNLIINAKAVNKLLKVVEEVNEEPLKSFMAITCDYFKDFDFKHDFMFRYCNMRHNSWKGKPLSVSMGYPQMGMKQLAESKFYTFAISVSGPQHLRDEFKNRFDACLKAIGYRHEEEITRLLEYRIPLDSPFPLMTMPELDLKCWLLAAYDKAAPHDLIDLISDYMDSF